MHPLRRAAAALLLTSLAAAPAGSAATYGAAAKKCLGSSPTIVGRAGPDRLVGTPKADVIVGLGGNDRIDGAGGDDLICAGGGADRVAGGPGADRIHGGPDQLAEGPAGSYLVGDVLAGGPGDDVIEGGTDSRAADQRRRPDTYSWADAARPVVVDLSGGAVPGRGTSTGEGRDTIVLGRAHGVTGSPYADTIIGSERGDVIHAGDGSDRVDAGGGDDLVYLDGRNDRRSRDTVDAGAGADLVSSRSGRDLVRTGRGRDFVEAFSAEPTVVQLGPGDDYLGQYVTPGSGAGADGGAGDDVVAFYGSLLAGQQPRARFVVDYRRGVTRATGEVEAVGTIAGFESHRLLGPLRWQFHGDADADRVWAVQGGPLDARGYAGSDHFTGSDHPDLLDGGRGTDHADGRAGKDRCRSIERGPC
jgi:Ca2+-binding RTX toxin-like protein